MKCSFRFANRVYLNRQLYLTFIIAIRLVSHGILSLVNIQKRGKEFFLFPNDNFSFIWNDSNAFFFFIHLKIQSKKKNINQLKMRLT